METTKVYWSYIGVTMRLYWDNGREKGSYYSILGLYWGNIRVIVG